MKHFIIPALLLMTLSKASAQELTEGKVGFDKKDLPAAIIELPYPPDVVEDALKDYLYRKGVKGGTTKGFTIFKGTKLSDLDLENTDVYFRVEKKSRKEKNRSIVYLFATRENEDPSRMEDHHFDISRSKELLKEMLPSVETNHLHAEILQQENSIKRAEKKHESLEEYGRNVEKKIKKLEEELELNKRNLAKQQEEIENQLRILENLKNKKKSGLVSSN